MPIARDGEEGFTISWTFRYEASFRLEHPSLDPAAVTAALAMSPDAARAAVPGRDGADAAPSLWVRCLPEEPDLAAALRGFAERLAPAREFLARVRAEGGCCGFLVLVVVDWNAMTELDADLLLRLADLGVDLTVHALAAESAETETATREMRALGLPF